MLDAILAAITESPTGNARHVCLCATVNAAQTSDCLGGETSYVEKSNKPSRRTEILFRISDA